MAAPRLNLGNKAAGRRPEALDRLDRRPPPTVGAEILAAVGGRRTTVVARLGDPALRKMIGDIL